MNFLNFDARVQGIFDNDETNMIGFSELLVDTALGRQQVEKKEANETIVKRFSELLGLSEKPTGRDVRKAIRRNQALVYDLIEESIQNLVVTGWQADPFMMKYAEIKNLALGDSNVFNVEDDSVLSMMRISGNHHDIFLITSVRTK